MNAAPFGFLIRGAITEARRLVDHAAAVRAYCSLDERAEVQREAYLSAFTFGADFMQLLDGTGSCRGFAGACWSAWLWFDIDRADYLQRALDDARHLAAGLLERYGIDDDALVLFFSGSKGFHLGLPTALFQPDPSPDFHRGCRRLAEGLAKAAGVSIDAGVYDRVRAFRAPNSRHPKTGLHKRRLSYDELLGLSLDAILTMAKEPAAFELPSAPGLKDRAALDWQDALALVKRESEAKAQRRADVANGTPTPTVNRSTLDFIRDGAGEGDRHRLLFSAAANLAEFACPPALAHALLTEAALDSGLSPADARRQIDCGLAHQGEGPAAPVGSPPISKPPIPSPSPDLRNQLAALWSRAAVEPAEADRGDAWEPPEDRLLPPDQAKGPYEAGF
jgi:hypothetical protein